MTQFFGMDANDGRGEENLRINVTRNYRKKNCKITSNVSFERKHSWKIKEMAAKRIRTEAGDTGSTT